MDNRLDMEFVQKYWSEQANQHGESPSASWSDQPAIETEIGEISRRLSPGLSVLDVGCANGYSTVAYASRSEITIVGIDYTAKMIESARSRQAQLPAALADRVQFRMGDIMNLDFEPSSFDVVISTRVVINLGAWENQLRAIKQCLAVIKPGGKLLLSEATVQGWSKMNEFRREWGLGDIPIPDFNNYLDELQVAEDLAPWARLEEIVNFSSTYYVGTRVLKPLLAKMIGMDAVVANPLMHWNRWFSMLPAVGDYGTQKLFVLQKHS